MNTLNQEADMGFITDIVSKIANALVMSTEFPAQMDKIKLDLHNLNVDLDRTKERNIELDNALNDTRRQRDEAEQALSQVKSELSNAQASVTRLADTSNAQDRNINDLKIEVQSLRKERDDYGMKQMEAEERASQAEAKLAKLAEALGLPKPEPKTVLTFPPEPALSQSAPQAVTEPAPTTTTTSHGMALAEPTPLKRIYEGEPGYHYNTYDKWDQVKQRYYNEVDDMPS